MTFSLQEVKGLDRCLVDKDIDTDQLSIHISQGDVGARAPLYRHGGIEAFYMLEGTGAVEVESESYSLGPNDSILLDPTKLHGLLNAGATAMRYMVILVHPQVQGCRSLSKGDLKCLTM